MIHKPQQQDTGRWLLDGEELTSGDPVEVLLGGHWITGNIEYATPNGYVMLITGGGTLLLSNRLTMKRPSRPRRS